MRASERSERGGRAAASVVCELRAVRAAAQVHCQLLELLELVEIKLVGEDLIRKRGISNGRGSSVLLVLGCCPLKARKVRASICSAAAQALLYGDRTASVVQLRRRITSTSSCNLGHRNSQAQCVLHCLHC